MSVLPKAGEFALPQAFLETERDALEAILSYLVLAGHRYLTIRSRCAADDFCQAGGAACVRSYGKAAALLRFSAAYLPERDERRLVRIRLADAFLPDRFGATYSVEGLFAAHGAPTSTVQGPLVKIYQDVLYAHQRLSLLAPSERRVVELVGHALLPICLL